MDQLPPKPPLHEAALQLTEAIKDVLRLEEELSKAQAHLDDLITTPNFLYNQPTKQHE
jgi:hypothetical protein